MDRKTAKVLGYNVDLLDFKEASAFIEDRLKNGVLTHIVTINPEIIQTALKDKEYTDILNSSDYVAPDGIGIKIALKLKGITQEQIPGIDLAKEIIKICSVNNYKIALIGAKENVIQKTTENLKNEFKNLNISYYRNGYFTKEEEAQIISQIKASEASVIISALGAPKQDIFINHCKKTIQNAIYIGVGGAFDVWAGEVKRAPEIYRKIGCEWLYRTIKQPERFKRIYKTLPLFLFKVIIEALREKMQTLREKFND